MRTFVTAVAVTVSLALASTGALAASATTHSTPKVHVAHARVAHRYAQRPATLDIGQLIGAMFGGTLPAYVEAQRGGAKSHGGSSEDWSSSSPSYDSSPVNVGPTDAENTAAQIQQMNDENAMVQSMQAAQEQNDEANAAVTAGILAAQQTEINANQ